VDAAVAAAHDALLASAWRDWTAAERGAAIDRLANGLVARKAELADLATAEIGSPRAWSTFGQVLVAAHVLRAYAAAAAEYPFTSTRRSPLGGTVRVRQLPVGVVGAIVPWNTPLLVTALKVGALLAAGCTTVLKSAPDAPLSLGLLADLVAEAGLPAGVVNIVHGGAETGRALVEHPRVDRVSFTGSTSVGAQVAATCGAHSRRCSTELGGKSAAIILDDAPLEPTVSHLVAGSMSNNGQLCAALTRILLPRNKYREFADAFAARVAQLRIGDPADRSVEVGPVINESSRQRIEGYIDRAIRDGATALCGGGRSGLGGLFVNPTVLEAHNAMEIARDEVFGPVAAVIAYDTDDQALEIANDSRYGLVGAVFSADEDRAAAVAARVRAGSVSVNSSAVLDFGSPFGGFKGSGVGREGGPEGIAGFVEHQAIIRQET
jgi:betaine-aldehyde dehydrogenase